MLKVWIYTRILRKTINKKKQSFYHQLAKVNFIKSYIIKKNIQFSKEIQTGADKSNPL